MDALYEDSCHLLRGHPDSHLLLQLKQSPVVQIDISHTYIGPVGGFDSFLSVLCRLDQLEALNMNFSVLSTDNVRDLVEVLKSRKNLKSLKLRKCKLYVESGNTVLSLLRVNKSIVDLDLSGNDVPSIVERKIMRQLELNRRNK